MNLYYQTKLGKLYHGDCFEFLDTIRDKSIAVTITDPPYGMSYYSNHYKQGNKFGHILHDDKYPADIIPILKQKTNKSLFCFCRWDNLVEVEKPKSFIVWAKNNWTAGDLKNECGRSWEGILFYPLENHKFNKRIPDLVDFRRVPSTKLYHPTQKPTALIMWLLRNCTKENDLILDCFMGSGTTAIACERLSRQWIGIEKEEKYCQIVKERLEKETEQLKLF